MQDLYHQQQGFEMMEQFLGNLIQGHLDSEQP